MYSAWHLGMLLEDTVEYLYLRACAAQSVVLGGCMFGI